MAKHTITGTDQPQIANKDNMLSQEVRGPYEIFKCAHVSDILCNMRAHTRLYESIYTVNDYFERVC